MFILKIMCTALLFNCTSPPPEDGQKFATFKECDAALIKVMTTWSPIRGGYTARCEKVQ